MPTPGTLRSRALALLWAATLVAGCSGGSTGGGPDAGADAGTSDAGGLDAGADAGAADAGSDAGTPDGGTGVDAGSDGGGSSHLVGGTIGGLAGTGLILQNGGADDLLVPSGATTFQFPAPLASGAGYAVTVRAQPTSPAQLCAVAGGTGTVGDSDVTSVSVTCATQSFGIGGTVSGATAAGLVLRLGGGGDLAIQPGATTFAFPGALPSGSAYAVTIQGAPAGFHCAVSSGTGTVGNAAVTDVAVACADLVVQRWTAPSTWGAHWPDDDPLLVQHAWFDGQSLPHETKGIAWGWLGAGAGPNMQQFASVPPFGATTRFGAGPFGPTPTRRYQAAGGDEALGSLADMIVCAVVKPQYDAYFDGLERGIVAKGYTVDPMMPNVGGGWILHQMHRQFCFHYEYRLPNDPGFYRQMAYTPTQFATGGQQDSGTLGPSYLVVCGGRDVAGGKIRVAANSFPDTNPAGPVPFIATFDVPSNAILDATVPATLGGYPNGDADHTFGGRIFETAVWRLAATPANLQAKLAAFQGLLMPDGTSVAQYSRNREAAFVAPDGSYHATWRHGPRIDPTRGFLFGLQGWNRLSTFVADADPGYNVVTANGEELDRWTRSAGATVLKDQIFPPGDSGQPLAERVTLAPGASVSLQMGLFERAGPIQGQLWLMPNASSGVLSVEVTRAQGGGSSAVSVDLSDTSRYPAGEWTRVPLTGLSTDGGSTRGTFSLQNHGAGTIDFQAWGVHVTQLGGGGDLGGFDPGPAMYDWSASDAVVASASARYPQDALQLPVLPASTATTGFCLSAAASMPDGLAWSAGFQNARTAVAWVSDLAPGSGTARLYLDGAGGTNPRQLCFAAGGASPRTVCAAVPSSWTAGSSHALGGCVSPAGSMRLHADGAQLGTTATGVSVPDLGGGHLVVGNGVAGAAASSTPWHGYVSSVVVCRDGGDPGDCR